MTRHFLVDKEDDYSYFCFSVYIVMLHFMINFSSLPYYNQNCLLWWDVRQIHLFCDWLSATYIQCCQLLSHDDYGNWNVCKNLVEMERNGLCTLRKKLKFFTHYSLCNSTHLWKDSCYQFWFQNFQFSQIYIRLNLWKKSTAT